MATLVQLWVLEDLFRGCVPIGEKEAGRDQEDGQCDRDSQASNERLRKRSISFSPFAELERHGEETDQGG